MKKLLPNPTLYTFIFLFFCFSGIVNAATITINTAVTYDASYMGADIIIASGATFTINSDAQINSIVVKGGGTLIVISPYTLTVGVVGNASTLQVVDFQNNSTVTINTGASLVVYGALNNSNNSTGITFNGSVSVVGNVTVGNNSTVIGSGSLTTTGSITGAGTVFGSGNDCSPGPCSGGNLCAFTNVISSNQNVCSNAIPVTLTSSTNASSPSYQWQMSTTSGGGFENIPGATNATYVFPTFLSQTTYYRLKITSSSCTSNSSQITITVTPTVGTPVFTLGGSSTRCQGAGSVTYTASATNNTGLTYSLDATTLAFAGNSIDAGTGAVTYAAGWSGTSSITASAAGCNGPKTATHTVTVNPISVGGTVTGGTTICSGSTSGLMTLAGHTGTIIKWQWSVSPFSTWTDISNSTATYTSGALSTSTQFRVVVQSGSCTVANSAVTTVKIVTPSATQLNTTSAGFSGSVLCIGNAPTLAFDANNDSANIFPFTITYKNNASPTVYTQTILNDSEQTFTPGDNPTSYAAYTLISIANSNCVRTTGFGDSTAEISFRPIPTATISGTTTVCKDATSPSITFTNPQTAGVTVTYNINAGTNSTVAIAGSSNQTVLVPTTAGGTFVYNLVSVVYNSPSICSAPITGSATVTITAVNTPVLDSKLDIDCASATGSIVLNNLPATGTYTLNRTGTSSGTTAGLSGTTQVITGLALGTYNFFVSNAGCTSQVLSGIVIQDNSSTITTDGSTWTNGLPTSGKTVIYNLTGAIALSSNVEACRLVVNSGSLTFNSGFTLKVTNDVSVAPGAVLTFESDASLVQINNVTNSGDIQYKRLTTPIRNTDYTYWSSPVSGFTLGLLSPRTLGDKFYSYEVTAGAEDWKQESAATVMAVGKGYIARGPQTLSGTIPWPLGLYLATFVGVPNNGDISISGVFADKSYLLGNPYPSALDAYTFLIANAGVLDGTLYFWTHNTSIGVGVSNPGTGVFAYSADDYASYNLTGGTATAAAPSDTDKSLGNPYIPTGKIAAGQSFFATSKVSLTGSSIVYNNNMRVGVGSITGTNSQFFRTTKNSKTAAAIEQNRVWLNLFNAQGAFKQTLVGYVTGASNNYENGFDGETFDANEFLDFYSVTGNQNLVIQGRALPFDEKDEVQLGFRAAAATSFNIGIDQTDGLLKNQNIFIEDKLLNVVHDLKIAPYSFTTSAGTFNDRFVLRFSQKTLGLDDSTFLENSILITTDKNEFKVKSEAESINRISVYDLLGKKVFNKENVDSNEVRISKGIINNQVVIVHVVLADGRIVSKKAL